jgi:diguanylate cyclase (GGDEF)-like protein/putative nucleotidyltransferase with HDIG domain
MVLALVYGVFLVLVGVTASALVAVASIHLGNSTLSATAARDRTLVELFVNGSLTPADVDADGPDPSRARELESLLATLVREDQMLRAEIRTPAGAVLVASEPGLRDAKPEPSTRMRRALEGTPSAQLVAAAELTDPAGTALGVEQAIEQLLPVQADDGRLLAVVALWRDAEPMLADIAAAQRDIVAVTLAAAAVLAAVLYLTFRAAQKRISGQHAQLVEAERRDPLTGLLNHGAVVGLLAAAVEEERVAGGRIGLALVDVDNFRLFNDTHGHEAADQVLSRVAMVVAREEGSGCVVARSGPDEFLVLLRGAGLAEAEAAVARVRGGIDEESVQFGESEPLPISVSAGICLFPDHASSATDLLSAVTVATAEARASGGDATCVARGPEEEASHPGSFDVFQGLILAVDTKDRYTKRHSEDVARYAVFLARRVGLDEELVRSIHLAGLLHDVGKIGIPDSLLRKPGRLTAEEFDVFKQHVALGDAIVRDVPKVDLVRAGIRHHHERWDGRGYLEGLEGEGIPLIGRVLAVADAFSAMTTSRPYRKALSVEEALKRLGDAAGSQLQEDLVVAFIGGIEVEPDAPLPGDAPAGIWSPERWVA